MAVATCVETPDRFRIYTVSNAEAVPRGTLMKLTSPSTCTATGGDTDPFAGIAWEEKTASDGITRMTCALNGIWIIASTAAAVTAGQIVNVGAANAVLVADEAAIVAGSVVGKSETTVGGGGGNLRVVVGEMI
jgi:hypothetical protein